MSLGQSFRSPRMFWCVCRRKLCPFNDTVAEERNMSNKGSMFTQIPPEAAHVAQRSSSTARNESRQVCVPGLYTPPSAVKTTPRTLNFFFISFSFFSLSFCSFFSFSCFSLSSFFSFSRRCFSFFFSSFSSSPSASALLSALQQRESAGGQLGLGGDSSPSR